MVHETLPWIHENVLAELDTKEGGKQVKRNKAEAKDACNGEEYLDGRGAGSGGPRLKKMYALDHVLTAHDPTCLEGRSKALLA
jgi:hypothetical protein